MSAFDRLTEGLDDGVKSDVHRVLVNARLDPNDPAAVIAALMGHVQAIGQDIPAAIQAAGDEFINKLRLSGNTKDEFIDSLRRSVLDVVEQLLRDRESASRSRWHTWLIVSFLVSTLAAGGIGYATGWLWRDAEIARLLPKIQTLLLSDSGQVALELTRYNDFAAALATCTDGDNQFGVGGRSACYVPLWLEGPPLPDKRYLDYSLAWVRGLIRWLAGLNPIWLLLTGFLLWPIARKAIAGLEVLANMRIIRWLFDLGR